MPMEPSENPASSSTTTAPPALTSTAPPALTSTAATWSVASGSLANSVTFESSYDDDDDNDQPSAADPSPNGPLILYPPSSDPSPCEITLTFSGKQELRQVYLRSTARVFEIYCTPELGSTSEYLCTVRCSEAVRDDCVLRCSGVENAALMHLKKTGDKELDQGKSSSSSPGCDLNGNEDGWVEVKAHDAPSSLPILDKNPERKSQDLYEATAEITNANPCTSITLKLLSLQDKGCVYVDEIYVYADPVPVDTVIPDNRAGSVGNAAGSSLMAMLMPAFFELSKAKDVGRAQDKCSINTRETQKSEEVSSEATDTLNVASEIPQVHSLKEVNGPTVQVQMPQVPGTEGKHMQVQMPQVSGTEGKQNVCYSHTEGVLDQLFSRVSRIEDLVLRFEESMVKPIQSINERLQRVEHQVEVLTKKTENYGSFSGTRISAPDFSCSESEPNSFDVGSRHPANTSAEANKKASPSTVSPTSCARSPALVNATSSHLGLATASPESSISGSSTYASINVIKPYPAMVFYAPEFASSDASSVSANSTKLHPGLVITAPEFSNCDDEEENHVEEPVNESSTDRLKYSLSSSTEYCASAEPKQERSFPELPNEEDDSNDKAGSQRVHFEVFSDSSASVSESDGIENHPLESVEESPKEKQKHTLTIDDALASTLAGLLASVKSQGYSETQELSDFLSEEVNNGEKHPQTVDSQLTADHSSSVNEADGTERMRSLSSLSKFLSDSSENLHNSVQTHEAGSELVVSNSYGDWVENVSPVAAPVTRDMVVSNSYEITEGNEQAGEIISDISAVEKTNVAKQFPGNQINDDSDTFQEEVRNERSNNDILQNIVEPSQTSTIIDFETPILEVNFVSRENAEGEGSLLESSLVPIPDWNMEAPSGEEKCNNVYNDGNQSNLISIEDWGAYTSASDGHIPVDMNYYNLVDQPVVVVEAESTDNLPEFSTLNRSHESQPLSLI